MLALLALTVTSAAVWAAREHASTPFDDTFDRVGRAYSVPPNLLRAIARKESGMNPGAVSPRNSNGTRDHGLMQLNDATLKRLGLTPADALDPAKSIHAAASLLRAIRTELGPRFSPFTWPAAYNVGSDLKPAATGEAYAASVMYHWFLYDIARPASIA